MKSITIRGEKTKKLLLDVICIITLLSSFASPSIIFADEIPLFDDGGILKVQNKSLTPKKETTPSVITSTPSSVPEVGVEWIKVKFPLSASYYSTAESQHKSISSNNFQIENLSDHPVLISLSGFVGNDGISLPTTSGIENLKIDFSKASIPLVTDGEPIIYKPDNSTPLYTLGVESQSPIIGGFQGPSSVNFSFSGSTKSDIDVSKAIVLNNQLNLTLTALDHDGNIPIDQSSINVHNSEITINDTWSAKDNFDGGTDQYGNPLSFNQLDISGDTIDTSIAGEYTIIYTYRNITQKAILTINDLSPKIEDDDTIEFVEQKWGIIKGPDQMGEGNYLIAIAKVPFIDAKFSKNSYYYPINDDLVDGYQNSSIKLTVDTWYKNNIQGTDYEKYIQPVVVNNPNLGDMKKLGWLSNTDTGSIAIGNKAFNAIAHPDAYPTIVDSINGYKQAFILSTSDVSTGTLPPGAGYCGLTTRTISYFKNSGLKNIWLRTPGNSQGNVSSIRFPSLSISAVGIINNQSIVPALVVHID